MIKKMIKGEKGFTLVELLAVIVILGIIVAIAIPAIGNVIKNAKSDANEAEITMIIDAARLYETRDGNNLPVTVEALIKADYLELRQGDFTEDELKKEVTKTEDGEYLFDGKKPGKKPGEVEVE